MYLVPEKLEGEVLWLAQFDNHLRVMMSKLKTAERRRLEEEEERWWAQRAGEFEEETNTYADHSGRAGGGSGNTSAAQRDAAWELTKKHNEAVFHAVIGQMTQWD